MSTNPILHGSEEWRDVQQSLRKLTEGQSDIEGRLDRYDDRQAAQHRSNKEEIMEMRATLYGIPGDEDNIGLIRKMDKMLNYGSATVFWARVMTTLLALALTAAGIYVAMHH